MALFAQKNFPRHRRYSESCTAAFRLTLAAILLAAFVPESPLSGAKPSPAETLIKAGKTEGDDRGGQVEIDLLSEVTAVTPGKPFTVGLWLRHPEGWHTYWKNPGIVGVATTFKWDLPEGYTAGPVQWPAPERTTMATLTAYGYERETCLLVDITPPEEVETGTEEVALKVRIGWMACATSCHPGWQDFELTLPIAKDEEEAPLEPKANDLFEKARAEMPGLIPGWTAEVEREGEVIELTVTPPANDSQSRDPEASSGAYFFSIDDQIDSDALQEYRPHGDGSFTLVMKRSRYAPTEVKTLSGVLFRESGWDPAGKTTSMIISAPWKS